MATPISFVKKNKYPNRKYHSPAAGVPTRASAAKRRLSTPSVSCAASTARSSAQKVCRPGSNRRGDDNGDDAGADAGVCVVDKDDLVLSMLAFAMSKEGCSGFTARKMTRVTTPARMSRRLKDEREYGAAPNEKRTCNIQKRKLRATGQKHGDEYEDKRDKPETERPPKLPQSDEMRLHCEE